MNPQLRVTLIGVSPEMRAFLPPEVMALNPSAMDYDIDKLTDGVPGDPHVILCGPPTGTEIRDIEVAQLLRTQLPTSRIFALAMGGSVDSRKNLLKNGFDEVFTLPADGIFIRDHLRDQILTLMKSPEVLFRPVALIDLHADTVLDFDTYIYLEKNMRHVRYAAAGSKIGAERLERLKKKNITTILIKREQTALFYKYTAGVLKSLDRSDLSHTERAEKSAELIRMLFADLASEEGGESAPQALDDCKEIIKAYVNSSTRFGNWFEKITALLPAQDGYSHASLVSTLAGLVGIGLGLEKTELLILAGLLHDIGLTRLPAHLQKDSMDPAWSVADRELYSRHPDMSSQLIKEKKMLVTEEVHQIITHHHEKFSGNGFPRALNGSRLSIETQVFAVCDAIVEEMTTYKIGTVMAVHAVNRRTLDNPTEAILEPLIMKKLVGLFPSFRAEAARDPDAA